MKNNFVATTKLWRTALLLHDYYGLQLDLRPEAVWAETSEDCVIEMSTLLHCNEFLLSKFVIFAVY